MAAIYHLFKDAVLLTVTHHQYQLIEINLLLREYLTYHNYFIQLIFGITQFSIKIFPLLNDNLLLIFH